MPSQMLMRLLREPLLELESQLPELKDRRDSAPIANDIFEAAVYWSQLGRWAFEGNTKVNYPARARGEKELLAKLRETIETKSGEDKVRYSHLLEVPARFSGLWRTYRCQRTDTSDSYESFTSAFVS